MTFTTAAHQPVVALSTMIFAAGDEVKAKSKSLPFWMTVVSVNERNGYCRCNFGATGNYAGNFHQSELTFHGGQEIRVAAH